jgi:uncharacterized protein (DUF1015 family)
MAKNKLKNVWLSEPEEHDFPAASDYLDLHFNSGRVENLVSQLREQKTTIKKAKDILRASSLPLLPKDNIHVKNNIKKFKKGKKLSPVLLVRNSHKLIIADGYHRISAAYWLSEDLEVPCRIV